MSGEKYKALTERIMNYIIFTLMDQACLTFETTGQEEFHDCLLKIRLKPSEIMEIVEWVIGNLKYYGGMTDELYYNLTQNKQLYQIVLDGILIVYKKYYTSEDSDEYAKYCVKKYYIDSLNDEDVDKIYDREHGIK